MKRFIYFLLFLTVIVLSSCGKRKEAEVVPASLKVKGPLGNFLEVVEGKYMVNSSNTNSVQWEIKVKLKNKGTFNADNNYCALYLDLADENGVPISGFSGFVLGDNKIYDTENEVERFRQFLKSPAGTEEWLTIYKESELSSVDELPSNIKKFNISSVVTPKESNSTTNNESSSNVIGTYSGFINGNYAITMNIDMYNSSDKAVSGSYYYDKNGSEKKIFLKGNLDENGNIWLEENSNGKKTGYFSAKLSSGSMEGTWYNADKSKQMPFYASINSFGSDKPDDYQSSSTGSGNCDEALNEYESFVDDYIAYIERASKGDMSALSSATSLMEKAQRAGDKLQRMGENSLGISCWEKYMQIQQKMLNAATRLSKNMPSNMQNMQDQFNNLIDQ